MAVALKDMKVYLSGGAGNTSPNASLGGIISSSTTVLSQEGTMSTMTGVTILDAVDNAEGSGTLAFIKATNEFKWTPPGGSVGAGVTVSGNAEIVVQGGGTGAGYIRLSIVFASLPGADASRTVTIAYDHENLFDDVTKEQALAGLTEYRCVYLKNTHGTDTASGVVVWIFADTNGGDSLAIGLDPAGNGNGTSTGVATTIADEDDVPSGVSFSAPLTEGAALSIGTLTTGQARAIWIRRTVPASTNTAVPENVGRLRFRFLT